MHEPLRVLTVARWYPSHDGPGRGSFVADLVAATAAAGVEAKVVSFDIKLGRVGSKARAIDSSPARAAFDRVATPEALFITPRSRGATGVPVARLPLVVRPGERGAGKLVEEHVDALRPFLRRLAASWRPDVIHAHTGLPDGVAAVTVARELGIPVVVSEHASTIEASLVDPAARDRYRVLGEPDVRLLAVSPSLAERIARASGLPADRIELLANSVAVDSFPPSDPAARDTTELLWVGTLGAHKGMEILLQAFARVLARRADVHLRLVGPERLAGDVERWRALAAELGVESAVRFEGWLERPAVARAMARAAVFVHPSPSETFGVVAAEAILTGLPVAARRSGGVPWIIDCSGGYGRVARDDTVEAFATAIEEVLAGDLRVDAASARARLIEAMGPSAVAERAIEVYRKAIGGMPRIEGGGSQGADAPRRGPVECSELGSRRGAIAARLPRVVFATGRERALRLLAQLPLDLQARVVLVAPARAGESAARDPGPAPAIRVVEVDRAAGPRHKRGSARQAEADRRLSRALAKAARLSGSRRGSTPIVALDVAAVMAVERLGPARARLAPGSLRWLADRWDVETAETTMSGAASRREHWSRLHARGDLSSVGQSGLPAELNSWLYRALERRVRWFARRHDLARGVAAAFDVGAGTGYWTRVWHDLGIARVDGCDLVPAAVGRLEAELEGRGDRFVAADVAANDWVVPQEPYGLVSAMNVLLHLTEDVDFERALANVAALVAPGGRLVMVEPILLDPSFERPTTPTQTSRARPLAAYLGPLLGHGLELVELRAAVAMANNPIEASSRAAYDRYLRWWRWVARRATTTPESIRWLGPLVVVLDRIALAAGSAPSSKIALFRRPVEGPAEDRLDEVRPRPS